MHLDSYDREILTALQRDARLTNNELSELAHLSPSQCSRRRNRLESEGIIVGYHAKLSRDKVGYGLLSMVTVTLASHGKRNSDRFAKLVLSLPEVIEAYALTGEMDYLVKVATKDLDTLASFVNQQLLTHDSVERVKTSIVLGSLKERHELPM